MNGTTELEEAAMAIAPLVGEAFSVRGSGRNRVYTDPEDVFTFLPRASDVCFTDPVVQLYLAKFFQSCKVFGDFGEIHPRHPAWSMMIELQKARDIKDSLYMRRFLISDQSTDLVATVRSHTSIEGVTDIFEGCWLLPGRI